MTTIDAHRQIIQSFINSTVYHLYFHAHHNAALFDDTHIQTRIHTHVKSESVFGVGFAPNALSRPRTTLSPK